jgi:RHS repeat-associated protein
MLGFTEALADRATAGTEFSMATGLDYFGARYFSGAQGRFTSPDPTFMTRQRVSDPQQWNLYSYTRNNPLKYIDPDGRELKLAIYYQGVSQSAA